jgi:3-hydroxyacyl-CoA dehydrogenase
MSQVKPIRRVAVVGSGVIGASWAALCLSRGFDVVATDPAPNAESTLITSQLYAVRRNSSLNGASDVRDQAGRD